ncbi:restriction endonuclease [Candidatus Gottesmanbacteria bacterium]|nr:restriction endonuclease [Candidatus Gottesmanbacteria bacterium]
MNSTVNIIKATGERVPFSREKIIYSIKRAGIPDVMRDQVVRHVEEKLYPDIPTSEIYRHITEFLGRSSHPYFQARYSLKRAIMELGPSGFPFEKLVAAILSSQGYRDVQTNVILQGRCVSHEIDVLAVKNEEHYLIECKFHNQPGLRTDVKVALYVDARFQDVLSAWKAEGDRHKLHKAWIATNTKCSKDAISYASCRGIKITAWGYPDKDNLQDMIESSQLHPITCLTNLSTSQKQQLLSKNIVLVKDLKDNPTVMQILSLSQEKKARLVQELNFFTS